MTAFASNAFASNAFDSGIPAVLVASGAPAFGVRVIVAEISYGQPSFPVSVSVVSPYIFAAGDSKLSWWATVIIGGVDMSARLTGDLSIEAAENSARLASFSVIPRSSAELAGYDGQPVTIDVTLFRAAETATFRRFTGKVETVDFSAFDRVARIACRDGYQDRPRLCRSAAEVEALFGGLAYPSPLLSWSVDAPDPAAYFSGLHETMLGACALGGDGLWRSFPWAIGTPAASFGTTDIMGEPLTTTRPSRTSIPSAIVATLNYRFFYLHALETPLSWEAVAREKYVTDGVPTLPKAMVFSALQGLSDWIIKGTPAIVQPVPGTYPVIVGGDTIPYVVTPAVAQVTCQSFSAVMLRRWYQSAQQAMTLRIEMGGLGAESTFAETLTSTFAAGDWESAPSSESSSGIYADNEPLPAPVKTGYEGLPLPWPAANSALPYAPDITTDLLQAALLATVAKAVKRAAEGKRRQGIAFERPIDPRWDLGAVLAVSAYGVSALGQVAEFSESLDFVRGSAISQFRLACPDGAAGTTGFSLTMPAAPTTLGHSASPIVLGNFPGASTETLPNPPEDSLAGYLYNVLPQGATYSASAPVYETQFRIVMPEIAAADRDPLETTIPVTATIAIAGGELTYSF